MSMDQRGYSEQLKALLKKQEESKQNSSIHKLFGYVSSPNLGYAGWVKRTNETHDKWIDTHIEKPINESFGLIGPKDQEKLKELTQKHEAEKTKLYQARKALDNQLRKL